MRKTGSRDPRESREASVVSPFSIAVNTFSIRFGSRRNQRPPHQKIRSITTVSATIDTSRIGHITGPPWLNLSMMKLPVTLVSYKCAAAVGDALGPGLKVAVTLVPGAAPAGAAPGAPSGG